MLTNGNAEKNNWHWLFKTFENNLASRRGCEEQGSTLVCSLKLHFPAVFCVLHKSNFSTLKKAQFWGWGGVVGP